MATLLSASIGLATLAALLGRFGWPLELFSHFRPHLVATSLLAGALLAAFGAWPESVVCVAALAANLMTFPKQNIAAADAHAGTPGVTLLWANVWKRPKALERTIELARRAGADVILLCESPDMHPNALAEMAMGYSFVVDTGPDPARFGTRIVALSKTPLANVHITQTPNSTRRAMLGFKLEFGGTHVNVYALHPGAPGDPSMLRDRDALIQSAFAAAQQPFLIAGDFNATPWSPVLSEIAPTRVGNPFLESTWLTRWPLLGLPIDHVFVSPEVKSSINRVGPFLGSDHRALIVRCHVSR